MNGYFFRLLFIGGMLLLSISTNLLAQDFKVTHFDQWQGDPSTLQTQLITSGEINAFTSKGANFLIDIPATELGGSDIAQFWIKNNEDSVVINSFEPFVVEGLPSTGESTLEFVALNLQGDTLSIIGKKVASLKIHHFPKPPLIGKDTVVFGILMVILAFVFFTSSKTTGFWKKFYTYVPAILVCYFLPGVLNSANIINGDISNLYYVSSRYLLPASLVLFTISIDLKEIRRLGSKAVIMFFTGTIGIMLGGPLAVLIVGLFAPDIVGGDVWRGLATIAGSWIGGGANQTAMKEVFEASGSLFSKTVAVDIIVANIWMGFLLYFAGRSKQVDKRFKADASAIEEVKEKIETYQASVSKIPKLKDTMVLLGIAFAYVSLAHFLADLIAPWIRGNFPSLHSRFSLGSSFFWLVVLVTTFGLLTSFNSKARALEGVGASRMASVLLYILVASVGTHMNLLAIFENPGLFLVGLIWIAIHAGLLLGVARIIKAPFFFVAVGSQANVGGAASAPVVAAAFHPSLAPVGVLLAVLGYAAGTYGAQICGILMSLAATP